MSVVTNDHTYVCDNCEGTWTGTWAEVQKAGWKNHQAKGATFIMCGDCETEFAQRRKAKEASPW